jgi:predicted helicase
MIGLYLLTTNQLAKDETIKFGMSMRIEYRWIDYLAIFSDSKYVYYYEFLDKLTREEILIIEDEILQLHKNERNHNYQTEYFYCKDNKQFHQSIIDVLRNRKIYYKDHNTHEFDRKYYDNKPESFQPNEKLKQIQIINNGFTPYYYQQEILDKIENFYSNNDIGKIIWACGLGKALLCIFIVAKLKFKSVVIGVPNIQLQKQIRFEIMRLFPNDKNILYVGGTPDNTKDYKINSTTNIDEIDKFIHIESSECKFLVTTYNSCSLLSNNYTFDFKIGDEAHHLVGKDSENYKKFHTIKSKKILFMTATEKIVENNGKNEIVYSMEDENIFGKIIDSKSISWAIENKKITDYNLVILKNTEEEIDNVISSLKLENANDKDKIFKNKELFLSAYMALKSIEKYEDLTHILIYTNETANAILVIEIINNILKLDIVNIDKDNCYINSLHSKSPSKKKLNDIKLSDGSIKEGEISKFKKSSWGIISSVYLFGEGFDCPKLNGVVFAEKMDSAIRIVQSTLRPNRLDKTIPNKKAYVIIPYLDNEKFTKKDDSYEKCRILISRIRNEDKHIETKINVVSIGKPSTRSSNTQNENILVSDIVENAEQLNNIKLRLRYSKALDSELKEEEDEYNYVKQLNKELDIQSKEEYSSKQIKDKHINYIDDAETHFKSKCVWINWYDFIGVDTKKFIQDKNDWINFCKENNVKSLDEYNELCKLHEKLPMNPQEFYIGCLDIDIELEFNTKRRTYSE